MSKTILDEAAEVTSGDRRYAYGHPSQHLAALAETWTAYLKRRKLLAEGAVFEPKDVALMMVLLKVDREANAHKRDNLVDICGWARTVEMLEEPVETISGRALANRRDDAVDALVYCGTHDYICQMAGFGEPITKDN